MSSPSSASDDSFSGASPQPSIACETAADVKRDAVCRKRQRAAVSHRRQAETPAVSEEDADPNETEHERVKRRRKEQRMQRNRLSAARSRKRKEDMLETLSKENASLRDELALLKSQLAAATSQGFAANEASCHVPNSHCDFCGRHSSRVAVVSPSSGVSEPAFQPSSDDCTVISTDSNRAIDMPATDAEFCCGSDAVCTSTVASSLTDPCTQTCDAITNDFIDFSDFNSAPASIYDAPTNAIPVATEQQQHAPPPPTTTPVEDHAAVIIDAIDTIDADDFDFAMDCYDVHPDDLLRALL